MKRSGCLPELLKIALLYSATKPGARALQPTRFVHVFLPTTTGADRQPLGYDIKHALHTESSLYYYVCLWHKQFCKQAHAVIKFGGKLDFDRIHIITIPCIVKG